MNKHDILKLIKVRREKCVGIAFNKHKIYYAVSGDDINPITNVIAKDIEVVIGNQPYRIFFYYDCLLE